MSAADDRLRGLSRGLGWFSIALGAVELAAPGALGRALGLRRTNVVQAYGAREVATGVGLLSASRSEDRAAWLWARVAGDALDIATLVPVLDRRNPRRRTAAVALAAVIGVTALDVLCARGLGAQKRLPSPQAFEWRSGFSRSPEEMRGAASDFLTPDDMREPPGMRYGPTAALRA